MVTKEAACANIPVIVFCDDDVNSNVPLNTTDSIVPSSNDKDGQMASVLFYILAREILRVRGTISRQIPWEVPVDVFHAEDPKVVARERKLARKLHITKTVKEMNGRAFIVFIVLVAKNPKSLQLLLSHNVCCPQREAVGTVLTMTSIVLARAERLWRLW